LREAVVGRLQEQTGRVYDPLAEVVITGGALPGLLSALLATVDHGDEVVITDPTYAGFIGDTQARFGSYSSVTSR
jgi:aspartate/methionine/tyrosine aminotransferase